MKLVLDIGNSALKGGQVEAASLTNTFRLDAPAYFERDKLSDTFTQLFENIVPEQAGIASVVPAATETVSLLLETAFAVPVVCVHHQMRLPFEMAYLTPQTLGQDRLAAAAAAWTHFGSTGERGYRNVVVVDAGTAVNYEVIDHTGKYRGGAITSGPNITRRALKKDTAQLPDVPLTSPPFVIGRDTKESMQSGLMYAFFDGVAGMIKRLKKELGDPTIVIATGGWGSILSDRIESIDCFEPDLVLHGISALMDLNKTGQ